MDKYKERDKRKAFGERMEKLGKTIQELITRAIIFIKKLMSRNKILTVDAKKYKQFQHFSQLTNQLHLYLNADDSEEFDRLYEESRNILDKWKNTGDISPKDNAATVSFKLYDLYSDLQKDMKNIKNPIHVKIVNKETIRRSLIYHRCLNMKINMLMALIKFGKVKNMKKEKGTESFIGWCDEMQIGW